ncbi:MAG: preprotein translocase subunit YajC [Planctomycetota bacterium]|nr:preprotein translocase subunit YajC [Planctomycetota bacterium]
MNSLNLLAHLWLLAEGAEVPGKPVNPLDGMLLPLAATAVAFYFLLIMPERRKQAEQKKQLNLLKKNDRVVTLGGIIGTITNISPGSDDVTLRIDENNNTRVRVLRSAITRVLAASSDGDSSDSK